MGPSPTGLHSTLTKYHAERHCKILNAAFKAGRGEWIPAETISKLLTIINSDTEINGPFTEFANDALTSELMEKVREIAREALASLPVPPQPRSAQATNTMNR